MKLISATVVIAAALLTACSESPTAPKALAPTAVSFNCGSNTNNSNNPPETAGSCGSTTSTNNNNNNGSTGNNSNNPPTTAKN